jgi:plasmid stability protein
MENSKRSTIYFDPALHKALRLKAAATDRTLSDTVNDAVRAALAEDAEDLAAVKERSGERNISFDKFVRELKRRGRL